jgi:hypothetical protein
MFCVSAIKGWKFEVVNLLTHGRSENFIGGWGPVLILVHNNWMKNHADVNGLSEKAPG